MAKQINIDGYDICQPPVCEDNTEVVILSVVEGSIIVKLTVYNNDDTPSLIAVEYSINNQRFNNIQETQEEDKPWTITIEPEELGLMFLRAKVVINNRKYFSKIRTIQITNIINPSNLS